MSATRAKGKAVKEFTPENPQDAVRRSSRRTLPRKRYDYSPEEEPAAKKETAGKKETAAKKHRSKSRDKSNKKRIKSPFLLVPEDQTNRELSPYELERLENIRKNQDFLSSLKIFQISNELKQSVRPRSTRVLKEKPIQWEQSRRSRRLQNMEAEVRQLPHYNNNTNGVDLSTYSKKPSGPLQMQPVNVSDGRLPDQLLEMWTESSAKAPNENIKRMDLTQYCAELSNMKLTEDGVVKVGTEGIVSAAFHPSSSNVLLAAGDASGHVGLWNMSRSWGDDGLLLFEPHSHSVTCMAFSPANPPDLLSASYDGTVRRMDVEKAVFEEVYDIEDSLSTFDFLSSDGMSFLVGTFGGDIAFVDRRTPSTSHEFLFTLGNDNIRCVHVHPSKKQYFAVAVNNILNVYDRRFLKTSTTKEVYQLTDHTKKINSAYFSPNSGNRIITSCYDERIRIYDTSDSTSAPLLRFTSPNMVTTFWASKLSAVWDPKQDDCFAIGGSIGNPKCFQVFHESGTLLHSFRHELLTVVQSVVAFHPSRHILMGGNASGRLHVFTGEK